MQQKVCSFLFWELCHAFLLSCDSNTASMLAVLPLLFFLNLTLRGSEFSASYPSSLFPGKRAPGIYRRKGWVGHSPCGHMEKAEHLLHIPGIQPHFICRSPDCKVTIPAELFDRSVTLKLRYLN